MTENVVVVTGADPRTVLDTLQALDEAGALELRAAAIVRRDPDGHLSLDHEAGDAVSFADRHPRLGAVVTLLLGPLDTLLFGNQLVSLFGATERTAEELAVGHLAQAVPAGGEATIADIDEPDPAVLDAKLAGAIVTRRPYAEVEKELGSGSV
jgi:hypothetical protein